MNPERQFLNGKNYKPPLFFDNGHIQSIYPSLFRKFDPGLYTRERIATEDDDFLDLDWSCLAPNSDRLAIISHGLEGDTYRAYVIGMAKSLNQNGWDALAWNYRSCSGEINRQYRLYHNGATDDLECVIHHAKKLSRYKEIVLVGFSMGGNISLLYLGQMGERIDSILKKAIVFSVPCDLASGAEELAKFRNKIYIKRFLLMLHKKVKAKMEIMPDKINDTGYNKIKNFKHFDDRYTAPIHGFKDAEDYWARCSSKPLIPKIEIPVLMINAKNDPFLPSMCYPVEEAKKNKNVILKMPDSGGHVGFIEFNKERLYWSEKIAAEYLD